MVVIIILNNIKVSIFLPQHIKVLIINNKNTGLIIYNKKNYIILKIQKVNIYKLSNTLLINNLCYVNKTNQSNAVIALIKYIYLWDLFFIKKIKFKGKGYKIWKNKNMLFLIFNHSHIT